MISDDCKAKHEIVYANEAEIKQCDYSAAY